MLESNFQTLLRSINDLTKDIIKHFMYLPVAKQHLEKFASSLNPLFGCADEQSLS